MTKYHNLIVENFEKKQKMTRKTSNWTPQLIKIILIATLVLHSNQECCKDCLKQIKESAFGNVQVVEKQVKKTKFEGYCSEVFARDGSCCDEDDLLKHGKSWLAQMKASVITTKNIVRSFQNSVEFNYLIKAYVKKNDAKLKKAKSFKKG